MKQTRFFYISTLVITVIIGGALIGIFSRMEGNEFLFSFLLTMMGQFAPTCAYLITKKKYHDDIQLNLRWKFDKWMLLSIILPTLVVFLSAMLLSVIGIKFTAFQFQGNLLLISIATTFIGSLGEEIGWRGYFLAKMNEQYSHFKSSIIVGFLWGAWHFFKIASSGIVIYLLFVLTMTLLGIIMAYIYNKSDRSIINMAILHASSNFSILVLLWKRDVVLLYFILIPLYFLCIVIFWCRDKNYFKL